MSSLKKMILLIGVSLLSFTGFLDATIVSTALPAIQSSLHMSMTELQWVMNAYFLGVSAFMASMGRVADIFGRRKVFYLGTLLFGLASIGAGFATQPIYLILCRAVQGITTAITIPVGIALIHTAFDKKAVAKAMGVFGSITGTGLALGPVVGGGLLTMFGWPAVFLVNIPFILIGFAMCYFTVEESRSTEQMQLDYFGILFLFLTIGSLVFAVVEANTYGWASSLIIGSLILFVLALICLIITEATVSHPIISGSLFKNRTFVSAMLFSFAGGGLMAVILFIEPLYLTIINQKSDWMTGVLLFIMPLIVMASSPVIGQLNHRYGPKLSMTIGALFFLIATVSQMLFPAQLNYALLISSFVVFGIAWAIVNQSPAVALGESIHGDHLSVAIGALFSFFNIGAALLLAIGVSLFNWQALQSLLTQFNVRAIHINTHQQLLLEKFTNQPDKMSQVIQQLNLPISHIDRLFETAFMSGMHAMYWHLLVFAIISVLAVIFVMKKDVSNHH